MSRKKVKLILLTLGFIFAAASIPLLAFYITFVPPGGWGFINGIIPVYSLMFATIIPLTIVSLMHLKDIRGTKKGLSSFLKIAVIVASILAAVLAVFIIIEVIKSKDYYSHPLYSSYENKSEIKSFSIDGVEYKLVNNKWFIDKNEKRELIGFLDVIYEPIYTTTDGSNVLSVQIPSESILFAPYFRFDYVLPDMSISNIDRIIWIDPVEHKRKTIDDRDLINALSYEIDNNKRININNEKFNEVMIQATWLDCYFKNTPGIYFSMCLWIRGDGSFVCDYYEMQSGQYCEISTDLAERITEHKIDIDEYIKSIRDTEKSLGMNLD